MPLLAAVAAAGLLVAGDLVWQSSHAPGPAPLNSPTGSSVGEGTSATRLGAVPADTSETLQVLLRTGADPGPVLGYLRSNGIDVVRLGLGGRLIVVRSTAAVIASALGAQLYRWRTDGTGSEYVASDTEPRFPPDLAPSVSAVYGLNRSARGRPGNSPPPSPWPLADQLQTAYNARPLLQQNIDGSGVRVAIYAEGGFNKANVDTFAGINLLSPPDLNILPLDTAGEYLTFPYTTTDHEDEAELDIDAVHTIAPGATIDFYELPESGSSDSSFAENIVSFIDHAQANGDTVASFSYSDCEVTASKPGQPGFDPRDLAGLDSVFQNLSLQGRMSVFASSGDVGLHCGPDFWSPVLVNYPASDPYVTGVGGTALRLHPDGTIDSEQAWDDHIVVLPVGASGGGSSTHFGRPCWQAGPGVPPPVAGQEPKRLVPDVAAESTPGLTLGDGNQHPGTSLAAPLWAGFAALYDDYAQKNNDQLLGFANPMLYRLAATAKNRPLFDVTTAQSTADLASPFPGPGWDASTGLGSFNAWTLVHDAASPRPEPPCPSTPTQTATPAATPTTPSPPAAGVVFVDAAGFRYRLSSSGFTAATTETDEQGSTVDAPPGQVFLAATLTVANAAGDRPEPDPLLGVDLSGNAVSVAIPAAQGAGLGAANVCQTGSTAQTCILASTHFGPEDPARPNPLATPQVAAGASIKVTVFAAVPASLQPTTAHLLLQTATGLLDIPPAP